MERLQRAFVLAILSQVLFYSAGLSAEVRQKTMCSVNCVGSSCTGCVSSGDGVWHCDQLHAAQAANFCD